LKIVSPKILRIEYQLASSKRLKKFEFKRISQSMLSNFDAFEQILTIFPSSYIKIIPLDYDSFTDYVSIYSF